MNVSSFLLQYKSSALCLEVPVLYRDDSDFLRKLIAQRMQNNGCEVAPERIAVRRDSGGVDCCFDEPVSLALLALIDHHE